MSYKPEITTFLDTALSYEGDECVLWPFSVGSHGYGDLRRGGRHQLVHRLICEEANGPAPAKNLDAAHECGHRLCCTKRHISWKTRGANLEDKLTHGTHIFGEKHHGAILDEDAVKTIRTASRARGVATALAARYGVHPNTVYAVRDERSWKHTP